MFSPYGPTTPALCANVQLLAHDCAALARSLLHVKGEAPCSALMSLWAFSQPSLFSLSLLLPLLGSSSGSFEVAAGVSVVGVLVAGVSVVGVLVAGVSVVGVLVAGVSVVVGLVAGVSVVVGLVAGMSVVVGLVAGVSVVVVSVVVVSVAGVFL
jgi:hypothetical protein